MDAFGHKQLQGTAAYLAGHLGAVIGCKTRSIEFSTLQRSASHMASRVDVNEAFMGNGNYNGMFLFQQLRYFFLKLLHIKQNLRQVN